MAAAPKRSDKSFALNRVCRASQKTNKTRPGKPDRRMLYRKRLTAYVVRSGIEHWILRQWRSLFLPFHRYYIFKMPATTTFWFGIFPFRFPTFRTNHRLLSLQAIKENEHNQTNQKSKWQTPNHLITRGQQWLVVIPPARPAVKKSGAHKQNCSLQQGDANPFPFGLPSGHNNLLLCASDPHQ